MAQDMLCYPSAHNNGTRVKATLWGPTALAKHALHRSPWANESLMKARRLNPSLKAGESGQE